MAYQRERLACVSPVDIFKVDALDRTHPAVAVTLSLGKYYLQILLLDVRFDPYILKCDVLYF